MAKANQARGRRAGWKPNGRLHTFRMWPETRTALDKLTQWFRDHDHTLFTGWEGLQTIINLSIQTVYEHSMAQGFTPSPAYGEPDQRGSKARYFTFPCSAEFHSTPHNRPPKPIAPVLRLVPPDPQGPREIAQRGGAVFAHLFGLADPALKEQMLGSLELWTRASAQRQEA